MDIFAFHMELIGGNVASYKNAAKFSTQIWYESFKFAIVSRLYKKYHKVFINTVLNQQKLKTFSLIFNSILKWKWRA